MSKASLFLAAALISASAGAFAQAQAPAATAQKPAVATMTPAQQAEAQKQVQASMQVIKAIDQNQAGSVWDQSSSVAKKATKRADFVRQIGADRAKLGAPSERRLAGVSRTESKGDGSVPAGVYINISYATKFANSQQPVRELVSYHQDGDKVWRVAGYSVR